MTDESRSPANAPHDETPADVLGDLWNALDVLPAARSTPNLASSTIEMAAVSVARATAPPPPSGPPPAADRWRWMVAGVIVAACLTAGFVTGSAGSSRRSLRGPELMVVIKHLKVLQEAGSVAFLEAFAKGDYLPPMLGGRDGQWRGRSDDGSAKSGDAGQESGRQEPLPRPLVPTPELDAALADFRRALLEDQLLPPPSDEPAGEAVSDGDGESANAANDAAAEFEVNRIAFGELAPSQREAYVALAEALVDPQRSDLGDAARLWHAWVAFADPVERAGLVELPTSERLEWLERRMRQWRRFLPGRSGDGERSGDAPGRGGSGRGPGGPPRPVRG